MNKENSETALMKKSYINLLLNVRNLPTIPLVMYEVTKLLDNPRTSATDLGKLINKDQGLVAKILTVANSPLYGIPRRVATVEFAIVILGFDHIKNIVIALSMIEAFKSKNTPNWNRDSFWVHSLLIATAAKRIAEDLGYPKSGEAFTAGLLHDLGISIIQRYFNEEYNQICELAEVQQMRYLTAEEKVLGITHQEVGKILIDKWNLPQVLGDAILNHHNPSQSVNTKVLSSIIHLAEYMTYRFDIGDFQWDSTVELDEGVIQILNLGDREYLLEFVESYRDIFNNQIDSLTK